MDIITLCNSSVEEPVIEKPEYLEKEPTQAGSAEERGSFFLLSGNAEEGLSCSGFLGDPTLYSLPEISSFATHPQLEPTMWPCSRPHSLRTAPGLSPGSLTHLEWKEDTGRNN